MTARLILPADAPREEWLAARLKGVTASEIAVILGISPFDSPFNLFHRKRGDITDDYDNAAMSLGRHLEPWIADQWAADHPEFTVMPAGLYASTDRLYQMATPDRLLDAWVPTPGTKSPDVVHMETVSLLEIKSSGTYDGWGEDGTDQIPAYYRAQVLWQLDTLGLGEAHVTCLFLGTRSRRDYVVSYDVVDVDLMRKAAQEFLAQVERGVAPPIDHTPATLGALKQLHPELEDKEVEVRGGLADSYRAACDELKRTKKLKALIENALRAAMGSAHKAVDPAGETVATRSIYTVPGHTRAASTVDKLTPPRSMK